MSGLQTTNTVLAVRPCRFQSNPQTASSNAFQAIQPWSDAEASNRLAQQQFDELVSQLDRHGVRCIVIEDAPEPHTPDSVFPNNWISTHADGTVVLYPMEAVNRRLERRQDIVVALTKQHGFDVARQIDLSTFEASAQFLEGTGSLVFDRDHKVAFACLSSRTHGAPLDAFDAQLGFRSVRFDSLDSAGQRIYHTNVMMSIGREFAVICNESIPDDQRARVLAELEALEKRIVPISYAQLGAFCGNMLALHNHQGDQVLAMSQQACDALTRAERGLLEGYADLAVADIAHIETQSGGGVRCMLAEVHLPPRQSVVNAVD